MFLQCRHFHEGSHRIRNICFSNRQTPLLCGTNILPICIHLFQKDLSFLSWTVQASDCFRFCFTWTCPFVDVEFFSRTRRGRFQRGYSKECVSHCLDFACTKRPGLSILIHLPLSSKSIRVVEQQMSNNCFSNSSKINLTLIGVFFFRQMLRQRYIYHLLQFYFQFYYFLTYKLKTKHDWTLRKIIPNNDSNFVCGLVHISSCFFLSDITPFGEK